MACYTKMNLFTPILECVRLEEKFPKETPINHVTYM
jgi:hypothetical protein